MFEDGHMNPIRLYNCINKEVVDASLLSIIRQLILATNHAGSWIIREVKA